MTCRPPAALGVSYCFDVDFVVFGVVEFGAGAVPAFVFSLGVPLVCRLGALTFGLVMVVAPDWEGEVIGFGGAVPICRLGSLAFGFVMVAVLGCCG